MNINDKIFKAELLKGTSGLFENTKNTNYLFSQIFK